MEKLILLNTHCEYEWPETIAFEYKSKEKFKQDLYEVWLSRWNLSQEFKAIRYDPDSIPASTIITSYAIAIKLREEWVTQHGFKSYSDINKFSFKGINCLLEHIFVMPAFRDRTRENLTIDKLEVSELYTPDEFYNRYYRNINGNAPTKLKQTDWREQFRKLGYQDSSSEQQQETLEYNLRRIDFT